MKFGQEQLQQQRLVISSKMKQSLHLLKLPITELSCVIHSELEQNPLLEADEPEESIDDIALAIRNTNASHEGREDLRAFIENSYAEEESLFTHLLKQAKEHFTDHQEFIIAKELIGTINENGFFEGNLEEIALISNWSEKRVRNILLAIQNFDPPGIAATTIQEALLLQLKEKKSSLGYQIIKDYYDDMLHNRIQLIAKALSITLTEVYRVLKEEIAPLALHPGKQWERGHYKEPPISITSDVTIAVSDSEISVDVNEGKIPNLRINENYLKLLHKNANEETKKYLQEKLLSCKSLIKNIFDRNQTLYRIAEEIATYQSAYFLDPEAKLLPMTMKELGKRLALHESTIARAASGKYIATPRGVLAMRTFFTHGYDSSDGAKISSTSVKELVQEIIQDENRNAPYSDEKIAELIQERGVTCARRTIAKYRGELGLGNRGQRKQWQP